MCVCVSKGRDKCSEIRQLGGLGSDFGAWGVLGSEKASPNKKRVQVNKRFQCKKRIASSISTLERGSTLSSKHGGEGAMKDYAGPQDRRVSLWSSKDTYIQGLRMMVSVA